VVEGAQDGAVEDDYVDVYCYAGFFYGGGAFGAFVFLAEAMQPVVVQSGADFEDTVGVDGCCGRMFGV